MFGLFSSFGRRIDYNTKVQKLRTELQVSNDKSNQTKCNQCTYCCWVKPCNVGRSNLEPLAKHFGITPQELFNQYLVVDDACAKSGHYTLTPIRKQWKQYAGEYLPSDATWDIDTPCIFLDEEKKECKLHSVGVKPSGGKLMNCWEDVTETGNETNYIATDEFSFTKEELKTLVGWDGETNNNE